MPIEKPTRRRVLTLAAASAGVLALAGQSKPLLEAVVWRGEIMGATAALTLYDWDVARAKALIALCLDEVERLEQIFSLLRPDSEVSRLNRTGFSVNASADLLDLIRQSQELSHRSEGAFDISVQALWTLYSRHFARLGPDAAGPGDDAIAGALASVGWQSIHIRGAEARLGKPGMGLTFNSIARGYAVDRVGDILKRHGMTHVLIDLDNYLTLGPRPDGTDWRLGLADPRAPERVLRVLETRDRAVASAGGYGTIFDRLGLYHHIFDPHSGRSANLWAGATVVAKSATLADALSTALLVAPKDQTARLLAEAGGEKAYMVDVRGSVTVFG